MKELILLRGGYGGWGTCGWDGADIYGYWCNWDKDTVKMWANTYGGHWCCDTATEYCPCCG